MPHVESWSQRGMRRRRCRATRKSGEGTCVSKEAGVAVSQAPAPGVRQASKVQTPVLGESGVTEDVGHGRGFNLARQGLLGRGVTLGANGPGGRE